MKNSETVLEELKNEYADTLPGPDWKMQDDNFGIYLSVGFMISASFEEELVRVTISENEGEKLAEIIRFKEVMSKILGFPPYCVYYSLSIGGMTITWIEKNQEKHYNSLLKQNNILFMGLEKK
jgi:hypothetical protein